ncbi:MAG: diguanylate cyclase domain-containing protein, partial [Angustibacter sp.]
LVQPGDADHLAARVHGCFTEPFRLDGTAVSIGTSVGIAVHDPDSGRTAEQLLREADAAMYADKAAGRLCSR